MTDELPVRREEHQIDLRNNSQKPKEVLISLRQLSTTDNTDLTVKRLLIGLGEWEGNGKKSSTRRRAKGHFIMPQNFLLARNVHAQRQRAR